MIILETITTDHGHKTPLNLPEKKGYYIARFCDYIAEKWNWGYHRHVIVYFDGGQFRSSESPNACYWNHRIDEWAPML